MFIGKNISKDNDDIIVIHSPNPMHTRDEIIKQYGRMVGDIEKLGNIGSSFKLKHLSFENAAKDINKFFGKNNIPNVVIVCLEEASRKMQSNHLLPIETLH